MSDLGNLPRDFEEWFAKEHGGMTAHSFAKIFSIREPKKLLGLWELKQKEIDQLKAQLNNMEACYIEKKKECEAVEHQKSLQELEISQISQANQEWQRVNGELAKALRGES